MNWLENLKLVEDVYFFLQQNKNIIRCYFINLVNDSVKMYRWIFLTGLWVF